MSPARFPCAKVLVMILLKIIPIRVALNCPNISYKKMKTIYNWMTVMLLNAIQNVKILLNECHLLIQAKLVRTSLSILRRLETISTNTIAIVQITIPTYQIN